MAPQRLWLNLLANGQILLGLGLGAGFIVALLHVTGSSWGVALRRVPEAMTALLLPGAVLTLAVVFLKPSTWPWATAPPEGGAAWFREAWLSLRFFQARSVTYIVIWLVMTAWLIDPSRRQDREGGEALTRLSRRRGAIFLVVFAFTVWLSATDWLMSLDPHWFSTVFSVYQFAGIFLSALAVVSYAVVRLAGQGPLRGVVTEEHFQDLGKLLFAFSTFWMYIWFCQFMLIWYGNIPEEVGYYVVRVSPWWLPLFLLDVALNWAIPFLVLLPRAAKRRPAVLGTVSLILLVGRWLDLYLHVTPPVTGGRPAFGLAEAGPLLLVVGLGVPVFVRAFRKVPPVPTGDPLLEESLALHSDPA
ncbi:MAG TPA: hypothetical protein ENK19_01610 [Acidobacteria bacterium]|nr:hypothetical protein [Acidobacteriota bacterium]